MSVEDANGTSMDATHYSPEISAGSPTQPIPAILDEVHQLAVSELDTAPMPAVDAPAVRTLPVLSTPKTSEYVPPVVTTKEDITRALNSSLQEGFMTLADSVEKAVAEGDPAIAEDAIFTKDTKRVVTRAADFFATRPDLLPENFVSRLLEQPDVIYPESLAGDYQHIADTALDMLGVVEDILSQDSEEAHELATRIAYEPSTWAKKYDPHAIGYASTGVQKAVANIKYQDAVLDALKPYQPAIVAKAVKFQEPTTPVLLPFVAPDATETPHPVDTPASSIEITDNTTAQELTGRDADVWEALQADGNDWLKNASKKIFNLFHNANSLPGDQKTILLDTVSKQLGVPQNEVFNRWLVALQDAQVQKEWLQAARAIEATVLPFMKSPENPDGALSPLVAPEGFDPNSDDYLKIYQDVTNVIGQLFFQVLPDAQSQNLLSEDAWRTLASDLQKNAGFAHDQDLGSMNIAALQEAMSAYLTLMYQGDPANPMVPNIVLNPETVKTIQITQEAYDALSQRVSRDTIPLKVPVAVEEETPETPAKPQQPTLRQQFLASFVDKNTQVKVGPTKLTDEAFMLGFLSSDQREQFEREYTEQQKALEQQIDSWMKENEIATIGSMVSEKSSEAFGTVNKVFRELSTTNREQLDRVNDARWDLYIPLHVVTLVKTVADMLPAVYRKTGVPPITEAEMDPIMKSFLADVPKNEALEEKLWDYIEATTSAAVVINELSQMLDEENPEYIVASLAEDERSKFLTTVGDLSARLKSESQFNLSDETKEKYGLNTDEPLTIHQLVDLVNYYLHASTQTLSIYNQILNGTFSAETAQEENPNITQPLPIVEQSTNGTSASPVTPATQPGPLASAGAQFKAGTSGTNY